MDTNPQHDQTHHQQPYPAAAYPPYPQIQHATGLAQAATMMAAPPPPPPPPPPQEPPPMPASAAAADPASQPGNVLSWNHGPHAPAMAAAAAAASAAPNPVPSYPPGSTPYQQHHHHYGGPQYSLPPQPNMFQAGYGAIPATAAQPAGQAPGPQPVPWQSVAMPPSLHGYPNPQQYQPQHQYYPHCPPGQHYLQPQPSVQPPAPDGWNSPLQAGQTPPSGLSHFPPPSGAQPGHSFMYPMAPPGINSQPPSQQNQPSQTGQPVKFSRLGANLAGFVQNKAQAYLTKLASPQNRGHGTTALPSGGLPQVQWSGASASWLGAQPLAGTASTYGLGPMVVPEPSPSLADQPPAHATSNLATHDTGLALTHNSRPQSSTVPSAVPAPVNHAAWRQPLMPLPAEPPSFATQEQSPAVQQPVNLVTNPSPRPEPVVQEQPQFNSQGAAQAQTSPSASTSTMKSVLKLASRVQKMALDGVSQPLAMVQHPPSASPAQATTGTQQQPAASTSSLALLAKLVVPRADQERAAAVPLTPPDAAGPESVAYNDPGGDYHEYPQISLTPVRASGEPGPVRRVCHGPGWDIGIDITYYHSPSTPNFLACSWCHDRYVRGSGLENQFEAVVKNGSRCLFSEPRMTKRVWPLAKQAGDMGPAIEYMTLRAELPHCPGSEGAVSADNIQWYRPVARDIPGFKSCETCYEGIILGTSLADRFEKNSMQQGAGERWKCDFAMEFMKLALLKLSVAANLDPDGRWREFGRVASKRLEVPPCKPGNTTAHEMKWYRLRESETEHDICEACYLDNLALTPLAGDFSVVDTSNNRWRNTWCEGAQLSTRILIWICVGQGLGIDVFRTAIDKSVRVGKRCFTQDGITGGRWYNFWNEASNFGVCEACHSLILEPNQLAAFFQPRPQLIPASKGARYCIFNSKVNHWAPIYEHFMGALACGVFSFYEDYARKWSAIGGCSGRTAVAGQAWFGWDDCPVCAHCHETFAAGTALAASFPLRGRHADADAGPGRVCGLYSPRMRALYAAACESGDASGLLAASRARMAVWAETVPQAATLRATARAEREAADAHMVMSSTWSGMASMASAIGDVDVRYYSGAGYRSSDQMAATQAMERAMEGYERARNPALLKEIAALEARWDEVE